MRRICGTVLALALSGAANAAPIVYFGENQSPGASVSGAPLTARNSFFAQLTGNSTENFEGFTVEAQPTSLSFTGSAGTISANFAPSSGIICATGASCDGFGRFATSGSKWFDVSSAFSATFSTPIAAFGFYGTDIGDINGQLTVELIRNGGPSSFLTVDNTARANNGSLLFWGVIDKNNPFDAIRFGNTASGSDFFGFDDMTIGDVEQVTGVPEPATWAMMIVGMGAVGGALRRRRNLVAA